MIIFDMRTVIFSYVVTQIVSTAVILLLWRQNRARFAGTSLLAIDYIFQTVGLIFIVSRGSIPDWISINFSNALVAVGILLGLIGLERFVGRKSNHIHNYLIVTIYVFIHIWFTFIQPDLASRTLNSSILMLILGVQTAWLLFIKTSPKMKKLTRGISLVFVIFSLINVIRIADFFVTEHTTTNYFQSNGFEAYVLISFQILFILQTYNLVLMFYNRLSHEISTEEEKFSKAFHSSPYAIVLTSLTDSKIVEVNNGFLVISGYQYNEVLGKTTEELQLWNSEKDRMKVLKALTEHGKIIEKEFQFRKKSGETITCQYSAEVISVKNEKCVLSSINNITERMIAEEQLRETSAYLENLFDYANAPIIVWDTEYKITKFNHAFERLTGRSFGEVIRQPLNILFPEKTKNESMNHIHETAKGERWETVEIDIQNTDGTIKTLLWNSANIYGPKDNKIIATIAQGHDITERKRAEEKIQRFNEDLEQQVQKRTAELNQTIVQLEEQSKVFVGRELRMIELKKEIAELEMKVAGKRNNPNPL